MKIIKILVLLIISLQEMVAQELPRVLSTSPQAAAFLRYGEIPVDYSTGVPKIEIPIYTLKASFVEIPISISYHASGIKITDVPTPVGLGWVLNAGGAVARTVIGKLDEDWKEYNPSSHCSLEELEAIINSSTGDEKYNNYFYGAVDKFSDKYSYFTSSFSGSFRLEYSTNKPISVPFDNNIIKLDNINKTIEITDPKGNIWLFSTIEEFYMEGASNAYQPTSWYLTKVTNANNTDSIMFQYINDLSGGIWTDYSQAYFNTFKGRPRNTCSGGHIDCKNNTDCSVNDYGFNRIFHTNRTFFKLLSTIKNNGTTVKFSYSIDPTNRFSVLDSCVIKNDKSISKKAFQFHHSYFGGGTNTRTRLDKISANDPNTKLEVECHRFTYNNRSELPEYILHYKRSDEWDKISEDFWGYYNNAQSLTGIPRFPLSSIQIDDYDTTGYKYYSSNKIPNEDYAKTYIIESITYPTGGKTVFDFESNYASYGSNPYDFSNDTILGGLRIKKISNFLNIRDSAIIKEYKYSLPIYQKIRATSYCKTSTKASNFNCPGTLAIYHCGHYFTTIQDSPLKPITNGNGSIVYYLNVEEIIKDKKGRINGKTLFSYDCPNEVDFSYYKDGSQLQHIAITNYDRGSYSPLLSNKDYYKYENGEYSRIYQEINEYEKITKGEFITGLDVDFLSSCRSSSNSCLPYTTPDYYEETKAVRDVTVLSGQKQIDFVNNTETTIKITGYDYDDYTQLSCRSIQSSFANKTFKTRFKYPYHFKTQTPYDAMFNRNIITPVIEQIDSVNNTFLQSAKTNYKNWGINNFAPETVVTTRESSNADTRMHYHAYDNKGNILEVSKENDIHYCYFWSYNKSFPVVKADNIGYGTLVTKIKMAAQNSGLDTISWISDPIADKTKWDSFNTLLRSYCSTAVTVNTFTYNPLSGITSQTDQNSVTTYYEYDGLNRLSVIRDSEKNILKDISYSYIGNIFYNVEKSGSFYRNNCGTGYTYQQPIRYTVSAYKYTSTVSQTVADQMAIDEINSNGQEFANQRGICILAFGNQVQSGTFVKNDCLSGFAAKSLTYTVPAGSYRATTQEAANQIAISNLNIQGQNLANQTCKCYDTSLPFVKLYMENMTRVGANSGEGGLTYFDVVVRFYQDVNCTIPLNVNNLSMCIEKQTTTLSSTTNVQECYTLSGTSYKLYNQILKTDDTDGINNLNLEFTLQTSLLYNTMN